MEIYRDTVRQWFLYSAAAQDVLHTGASQCRAITQLLIRDVTEKLIPL